MKILNFGSVNIDHVYSVEHFVRPGETLSSLSYKMFSGGKGANQSIALARAGADVYHAGRIGADGIWLKNKLEESGIKTKFLNVCKTPTGHAIIQVSKTGENSIILFGGANRTVDRKFAEAVLKDFHEGDFLLLQEEISSTANIMKMASKLKLKIIFNPAPMNRDVLSYPLKLVDVFILNEIEGAELAGKTEPEKIIREMKRKFPKALTILTLGSKGVAYMENKKIVHVPAFKVKAVDTTAAGDTFIGYFLASFSKCGKIRNAINMACRASALCVMRNGAADSIPKLSEVRKHHFQA
jgi:ribokinase